MKKEEWEKITQSLAGSSAHLFKPKENQVIQDFIETASADKEFWSKENRKANG